MDKRFIGNAVNVYSVTYTAFTKTKKRPGKLVTRAAKVYSPSEAEVEYEARNPRRNPLPNPCGLQRSKRDIESIISIELVGPHLLYTMMGSFLSGGATAYSVCLPVAGQEAHANIGLVEAVNEREPSRHSCRRPHAGPWQAFRYIEERNGDHTCVAVGEPQPTRDAAGLLLAASL